MPGDEVGLEEVYTEVDKRIKTAIDALRAELTALLARKVDVRNPPRIVRNTGTGS